MINVAIVGCGVISTAHLNAYEVIPDANVVAVCDVIESLAAQRAREYGIKAYYTSMEDMLRREDIDVVDVCVPTKFHAEVSIKALSEGKHVICEKPMASNLKQADEMIEAAEKSNRLLLIGQSNRFLPMVTVIKKVIASGKLGDLLLIRMAQRFDNPYSKWAMNPKHPKYYWEYGGGPLIDSGVHGADLLNWMFKEDPKVVTAIGTTYPPALPFFTSANVIVEYPKGKCGVIQVNRETQGYPQYERFIEIFGEKGSIWGYDNFYRQTILTHAGTLNEIYYGKAPPDPIPTGHEPLVEYLPVVSEFYLELKTFIDVIKNKKEPPVKPEEARKALEVCIAAEISARSRKSVELPLEV